MVKILPAKRLGKIVIDGVVDAELWSQYATSSLKREYASLLAKARE